MKYTSTRGDNKKFSFSEVFLKGLADDGGLFIPLNIKKFDESKMNSLKKLNYVDLATEIIYLYTGDFLSKKELNEIEFTFNVSKYVKSNAIVLCNNFSTIGIGAGQPSRFDSCKIAIQKAKKFQPQKIKNSIAASDAFFPFTDGVEALIKAGVKIIIQPGGSIRDQEVINCANKGKVKMLFTDIRHFNH